MGTVRELVLTLRLLSHPVHGAQAISEHERQQLVAAAALLEELEAELASMNEARDAAQVRLAEVSGRG